MKNENEGRTNKKIKQQILGWGVFTCCQLLLEHTPNYKQRMEKKETIEKISATCQRKERKDQEKSNKSPEYSLKAKIFYLNSSCVEENARKAGRAVEDQLQRRRKKRRSSKKGKKNCCWRHKFSDVARTVFIKVCFQPFLVIFLCHFFFLFLISLLLIHRSLMMRHNSNSPPARLKQFHFPGASIIIRELVSPSFGLYLWPSALLLARWVSEHRNSLRGKTVIEVYSSFWLLFTLYIMACCGFPSISLAAGLRFQVCSLPNMELVSFWQIILVTLSALQNCCVMCQLNHLTMQEMIVEEQRFSTCVFENISTTSTCNLSSSSTLSFSSVSSSSSTSFASSGTVTVCGLAWGDLSPTLFSLPTPDFVLGADVFFDSSCLSFFLHFVHLHICCLVVLLNLPLLFSSAQCLTICWRLCAPCWTRRDILIQFLHHHHHLPLPALPFPVSESRPPPVFITCNPQRR